MALDNCKVFKPEPDWPKGQTANGSVGPILSKLLAQRDFQLFRIAFNPFLARYESKRNTETGKKQKKKQKAKENGQQWDSFDAIFSLYLEGIFIIAWITFSFDCLALARLSPFFLDSGKSFGKAINHDFVSLWPALTGWPWFHLLVLVVRPHTLCPFLAHCFQFIWWP